MKMRNKSLLLALIVLIAVTTIGIGTASAYCSPGQIFPNKCDKCRHNQLLIGKTESYYEIDIYNVE